MHTPTIHIFCKIVDNYGDIGVCWRLARQLADEQAANVTLIVDDLQRFAELAPTLVPESAQQCLGALTIQHWCADLTLPIADLVIEGFACRLPNNYLSAMAARAIAPVWLNLEYLSAEAWVEDCHLMPSVQPDTGLIQHFWFPGFSARTGGLLRERALIDQRLSWQHDGDAQNDFWAHLGIFDANHFSQRISLFAYRQPALAELLNALATAPHESLLLIPKGLVLTDVLHWLALDPSSESGQRFMSGQRLRTGQLSIHMLPLLSHDDYDRLLWSCHWNAVRGEDSFIRAQWSGRPFLWHIYEQDADAHWLKLDAFIATMRHADCINTEWTQALRAWNGHAATHFHWQQWLQALVAPTANSLAKPALAPSNFCGATHVAAEAWCRQQLKHADLASELMRFYANQVESRPLINAFGTS